MGYRSQSTKFLTYSNGKDGTGVNIKGSYETYDALIAAHPTGAPGDAYLVKGILYVWPEDNSDWVNAGNIQGPTGPTGPQGTQGPPGQNGESTYFHVKYADDIQGNGISDNPKPYIGTYVDNIAEDSLLPEKYKWSRIEGKDGQNGIDGINGVDGKTFYLHIAYATSADGSQGFSTTDPVGKTYMGQYVDENVADPETPSVYTWSLIKGDKGDPGVNGTNGKDGNNGANGKDGVDGKDGAPALPANTSENIRVFLKNNSFSPPDKPGTGAILTDWVSIEITADETNQYVWTCTGNKITTYSWKDETTKAEYEATITHGNWTKPELWGAWGADNIDQKTYATYLKLMNGKEGGLAYDPQGRLYIKAELIQANNILVTDSNNRTILSASGSGTNDVLVQIGGWNVDYNNIYHLIGNTTNGYQIQMSALSGNTSVAFGVHSYQNTVESWPFFVRNDGYLHASYGNIAGWTITDKEISISTDKEILKLSSKAGIRGGLINSIGHTGVDFQGFQLTKNGNFYVGNGNGSYLWFVSDNANNEGLENGINAGLTLRFVNPETDKLQYLKFNDKTGLEINATNFTLDSSGNVFVKGEIEADSGNIGGIEIEPEGIASPNNYKGYQIIDQGTDYQVRGSLNINSKTFTKDSSGWYNSFSWYSFQDTASYDLKFESTGRHEIFILGVSHAWIASHGILEDYWQNLEEGVSVDLPRILHHFEADDNIAIELTFNPSAQDDYENIYIVHNRSNSQHTISQKFYLGFKILKTGAISCSTINSFNTETEMSIIGTAGKTNLLSGNWAINGTLYDRTGGTITGSDIRMKANVQQFNDKLEILYNNIIPCSFKYKSNSSNRTHTGYIVQNVLEAMKKANLSTQDFAAVCQNDVNDPESYWGLRYSEFIALNTWQIQKLKPRMTTAEQEILQLKSEIKSLRAELQNLKNS